MVDFPNPGIGIEELIVLLAGAALVLAGGVTYGVTSIAGVILIADAFGIDLLGVFA